METLTYHPSGPRFVDKEKQNKNRLKRETHARKILPTLRVGQEIEIKKTGNRFNTEILKGIFDGIDWHRGENHHTVQRGIYLKTERGIIPIRLRSIIYIVAKK